MRTTLHLDDQLMAATKQEAARTNRSLKEVVADALRQYFSKAGAQRTRNKPIDLPSFAGEGLRSGVDLSDTSTLLDLLDEREQ